VTLDLSLRGGRARRFLSTSSAVRIPRFILKVAGVLIAGACCAQIASRFDSGAGSSRRGPGRLIRIEEGHVIDEDGVRTARETTSHSADTPEWTNPPAFKSDVFTFARVIFQSEPRMRAGTPLGRRLGWWVDYPDADLNLSYRLQQMTSIRTDPDARVLKLTDPDVFRFPLLYMEHAGYMALSDQEVVILRKFLTSGGTLFVNDFWGEEEWNGFAQEIQRVLPGRQWVDLDTSHPVFHCVYDLQMPMQRMQIPTIQFWNEAHDPNDPASPLQRIYRGEGSEEMHVRAMLDAQQRIVILAIHNSDVSDGWEREAENQRYFNEFSEKVAYPLAINIIVYLMTH
jgi:hypothetical protein